MLGNQCSSNGEILFSPYYLKIKKKKVNEITNLRCKLHWRIKNKIKTNFLLKPEES